MDRGTCQDTVHGVTRVGHDLATTPPPPFFFRFFSAIGYYKIVNIVPCAIQQVHRYNKKYRIYFIYSIVCMLIPNSVFIPPYYKS